MASLNRDTARQEGLTETGSVQSVRPRTVNVGRPVSVVGWSAAILAGLLIWAVGFLLLR